MSDTNLICGVHGKEVRAGCPYCRIAELEADKRLLLDNQDKDERIAELEAQIETSDAQWREIIFGPIEMHPNEPLVDAIWRKVKEGRR